MAHTKDNDLSADNKYLIDHIERVTRLWRSTPYVSTAIQSWTKCAHRFTSRRKKIRHCQRQATNGCEVAVDKEPD